MAGGGAAVGMELGAGEVRLGYLRGGRLSDPVVRAIETSSATALVDQLAAIAAGVRPVPDAVGLALSGVDLPLADVLLRKVLRKRLRLPVAVDSDGRAVAFAEAHDEGLRPSARHLVLLLVGERVRAGLVLDGHVYRGAHAGAGELGHAIVGLDLAAAVPAPMWFPQPGSFEFVASTHALDQLAAQASRVHPESVLARLRREGRSTLGVEAAQGARAGDKAAARMFQIWGQRLGIGVANAINTLDPEEVVIAGAAALAGELILAPARRIAASYVRPGLGEHTKIRLARHGERGAVLGAALLALDELSH
ncbi:MAG TPA: ROK family protein [Solirubrobacteraceae bacterium]|jgi:glucokinase|nr:ROK family protein [Solirubrobacteraceae bacterium]